MLLIRLSINAGKSLAGKSKVAAEKGKAKRKNGNVENKEIRGNMGQIVSVDVR